MRVHPALAERAPRVVAEEQEPPPLLVGERRRVGRVRHAGLAAVRELGLVALAAPRARDEVRHQCATPAAPCSSISAPVVNRSSENGAFSSCGSLVRERPRERPARARRRLEAARPPAAVQVQPLDRGRADDRRRVRAHVHDPRPRPQHPRLREDREELERRRELPLDHVERAALRVGVERVDAGAHNELALVRLADVDVHRVRHHDRVEHLLVQLRDERLQRMRLDRHVEPGHLREHGRVPGGAEADLPRRDRPERRLQRQPVDPGDLAALDQVDAERVRGARVPPRDVFVPRDPAARLEGRAKHRVAGLRATRSGSGRSPPPAPARATPRRFRSAGWRRRAAPTSARPAACARGSARRAARRGGRSRARPRAPPTASASARRSPRSRPTGSSSG